MSLQDVAGAHYRQQAALSTATRRTAARLWAGMSGRDLDGSWLAIVDRVFVEVSAAQLLAASTSEAYVSSTLLEQGGQPDPAGSLEVRAFAGVASDGRDLEPLLYSSVTTAKEAIASGLTPANALQVGASVLDRIVGTQVPDAGRAGVGAATIANFGASGWVRMLNPPACSRCVVLAGRFFRTNAGFDRHPKCDCVHVPAVDALGVEDVRTDPAAYFRSLDDTERRRVFTDAGAQAIEDGADLNQVVNARRGASGLSQPGRLTADEQRTLRGGRDLGRLQRVDVFGRPLAITTEGTTVRGLAGQRLATRGTTRGSGDRYKSARAPRLMPEAIYEIAGDDRSEAVRLLRRFGYIT